MATRPKSQNQKIVFGNILSPKFHYLITKFDSSTVIHKLDEFSYRVQVQKLRKEYSTLGESVEDYVMLVDNMPVNDHSHLKEVDLTKYSLKATEEFNQLCLQRKRVYVDVMVEIAGKEAGEMRFELYNDICPLTVQRFVDLVNGFQLIDGARKDIPSVKGAAVSRLLSDGWAQFNNDLPPISDENFVLSHDRPGVISMVNNGPNSATGHFMIIFNEMPCLDKKAVVFGQVVSGFKCLREIQSIPEEFEQPDHEIRIADCKIFGA